MVVFPKSVSKELSSNSSNMLYIDAIVNVNDINFKEGISTQSFFHLSLEANESFGVVIFSPSLDYNNLWDDRTSYLDGWCEVSQQYFPRGLEVKFNLKEIVFLNDVLEYGILFGINITTHKHVSSLQANLKPSLQDAWTINGTIEQVSEEEGAQYTAYGIKAINSSIQFWNLKELYLLRIQISRKPNLETTLFWIPPISMFFLLAVSGFLIWKKDLGNSLRVYLAVIFFAFSYLSLLRDITPPTMTSIESLTLFNAILCLLLSIFAILWIHTFPKRNKP